MQCEANNTCAVGKSGNPGSVDMTIQVGGNLVVQSGAVLDMRGDVTLSGELDIFGGTFTLDPVLAGKLDVLHRWRSGLRCRYGEDLQRVKL